MGLHGNSQCQRVFLDLKVIVGGVGGWVEVVGLTVTSDRYHSVSLINF